MQCVRSTMPKPYPIRGDNHHDVIFSNAPNCYLAYNMELSYLELGMKVVYYIIIADPLQSSYVSCLEPVLKIKVLSGDIDYTIAEL